MLWVCALGYIHIFVRYKLTRKYLSSLHINGLNYLEKEKQNYSTNLKVTGQGVIPCSGVRSERSGQ